MHANGLRYPFGTVLVWDVEHGGWSDRNREFCQKFGDWPHLLGRFSALTNGSTR